MKIIIAFMLISLCINMSWALDATTETSTQQNNNREQSLTNKQSMEETESEGKRQSQTENIENTTESQQSSTEAFSYEFNRSMTTSINALNVFIMLADFELKTPADFGLTGITGRMIDSNKLEYLKGLAESNAPLKGIRTKELRAYMKDLATLAFNMKSSIPRLKAYISEIGKPAAQNSNNNAVDLFADEIYMLALQALTDSAAMSMSFSDQVLYKQISGDIQKECTFYQQSMAVVKCGAVILDMSSNKLLYKNQQIFSGENVFGMSFSIEAATSDSYSRAIEKMKSASKLKSFAMSVDKYTEDLKNKGKYKEAVLLQKRAIDMAKSSKANVSLSKILPQLN